MNSRRSLGRRSFIALAGVFPLALAGRRLLAADAPAACADPAKLSLTLRSRRRSLNYVEPAPDPKRRCGGCAFFTAGTGGCGGCQLMTGGPVSAHGVCNSFAAKGK